MFHLGGDVQERPSEGEEEGLPAAVQKMRNPGCSSRPSPSLGFGGRGERTTTAGATYPDPGAAAKPAAATAPAATAARTWKTKSP